MWLVKALLTDSTIINYHIIPQVICEMWSVKYLGMLKTQKQSSRGSVKKVYQSLFFNKVACLRPATLLKKSIWHRYFPVNFVKFLRTLFFIKYLWCGFWKHNVTTQTTAEFTSNITANIKLSEHLSFFLLTSNKFFTKSKNVAAKKLCGGVVALKVRRKLTCYSYFAML